MFVCLSVAIIFENDSSYNRKDSNDVGKYNNIANDVGGSGCDYVDDYANVNATIATAVEGGSVCIHDDALICDQRSTLTLLL